MDGRALSRVLSGLLIAGAFGCKNASKYPQNLLPQGGDPPANILPTSGGGLFGSKPPPGLPIQNMMPVTRKKGPLSAEFEVAVAETRLQIALAEPPPTNRDALLDSARTGFQRALKQDHKYKGALLGMARMYAKVGDKDHAIEWYDKYLQEYPKDAACWHEIAQKRAQWKDFEGANLACQQAVSFEPENRTFRKSLGFYQALAGKWDEAFASLSKVMPEAQARHNLAGMLDQMGQADACRRQLQLALKADPNYAPSREFLNGLNQAQSPENAIQQASFNEAK